MRSVRHFYIIPIGVHKENTTWYWRNLHAAWG